MLAKYEVCTAFFHGLDYQSAVRKGPNAVFKLLPAAQEHILKQDDGKDRLVRAVTELSKAFALAVPADDALRIRDEVALFQAVKAALVKRAVGEARPQEDLDAAIRQIVSRAVVASDQVVDIFAAAGLNNPAPWARARTTPRGPLASFQASDCGQRRIRSARRLSATMSKMFVVIIYGSGLGIQTPRMASLGHVAVGMAAGRLWTGLWQHQQTETQSFNALMRSMVAFGALGHRVFDYL